MTRPIPTPEAFVDNLAAAWGARPSAHAAIRADRHNTADAIEALRDVPMVALGNALRGVIDMLRGASADPAAMSASTFRPEPKRICFALSPVRIVDEVDEVFYRDPSAKDTQMQEADASVDIDEGGVSARVYGYFVGEGTTILDDEDEAAVRSILRAIAVGRPRARVFPLGMREKTPAEMAAIDRIGAACYALPRMPSGMSASEARNIITDLSDVIALEMRKAAAEDAADAREWRRQAERTEDERDEARKEVERLRGAAVAMREACAVAVEKADESTSFDGLADVIRELPAP